MVVIHWQKATLLLIIFHAIAILAMDLAYTIRSGTSHVCITTIIPVGIFVAVGFPSSGCLLKEALHRDFVSASVHQEVLIHLDFLVWAMQVLLPSSVAAEHLKRITNSGR